MRRREFVFALGSSAAWPVAALGQQSAMPKIGFLNVASPAGYQPMVAAFRNGLRESGYVESQNVAIEFRWADHHSDRLPALLSDLVHLRPAVIAATSTPAAVAAKAAIGLFPIVFEMGGDPVQLGLVASLNRPGANITGVTQLNQEVAPKRLELLHELVPSAKVVGLLINPKDPTVAEPFIRSSQATAHTLGLDLHVLGASTENEFDGVFASLHQLHAGGLVIGSDALFTARLEQLASLALRHAMPAVFQRREFAVARGLASYGGDITEAYRLAGSYCGRILKGEKPANLPVLQATKVELYINLKTAKALGVTVPLPLLGRADEVIE